MIKKKKSKKKNYFTLEAQDAIIAYNKEEDPTIRNKIYNDGIKYPFEKMVENIIHTFKFYYFDYPFKEVQHEVVSFLIEKMPKYTEGKGKAFSYFSIVAKNYLIIQNNSNYAKMKLRTDTTEIDGNRNVTAEVALSDHQDSLRDFTNLWVDWYDKNMNTIFYNKRDIIVADTILELFRIRENIENFNKKALYILIRERTGLKTQNITKVLNIMKRDYMKMYAVYRKSGHIINIIN